MDNADKAVSLFKQGWNCSQAVLAAYSDQFGLPQQSALKVAAGFGGGMRMAETCGAVTGAFMAIGLKYGPGAAGDKNAKFQTYKIVRQFVDKFSSRNGSVICKELLGCDISTPEGAKAAREKGLFASRCAELVQDAAEILQDMLAEHK